MLRVVLAAVLALAILGVAFPAVEDAGAVRADRLTAAEADRFADAVTTLARDNPPVADPSAAARTVLTLSIPTSGPFGSEDATVAIGAVPGESIPEDTGARDLVAFETGNGDYRVRWVPVDVRVVGEDGLAADDDPLVVTGRTRLSLSLVTRNGTTVVLVTRGV